MRTLFAGFALKRAPKFLDGAPNGIVQANGSAPPLVDAKRRANGRSIRPLERPTLRVAVIGLGRIGMPAAANLSELGHTVIGIDRDRGVIDSLRRGTPHFVEPGLAEFLSTEHNVQFESDLSVARSADAFVITIGVTLDEAGNANLTALRTIIETLRPHADGKAFIIRSTVPLGTCRAISDDLKGHGLPPERCPVVFMPERLVEGRALIEEAGLPRIVGSSHPGGVALVRRIYGDEVELIEMSSTTAAEMVKLADNAYRATMFAFSNDLALLGESAGVNASEVIAAANRHYPRNRIARPSYGVSGYCLTKDPWILESSFAPIAAARGFASVWAAGRRVNDYMVEHFTSAVFRSLQSEHEKVAILGLTFKEDVDDCRMSHGVALLRNIIARGHRNVCVYDPILLRDGQLYGQTTDLDDLLGRVTVAGSLEQAIRDAAVAAITVPHREFLLRLPAILNNAAGSPMAVVDGWHCLRSVPAHVTYRSVGNA